MKFKCGIYQITNMSNNKCYYGSTNCFYTRRKKHFNHLRRNIHHNKHLQNAWNKYGEENFVFEQIIYCEEKDLGFYETLCINFDYENNYNISYETGTTRGVACSEQTKQKLRNANLGKKHSEETKKKMSLASKGRRHSEETKKKCSLAKIGNKYTLGYKHSDKTKQKIREARKNQAPIMLGKKHSEQTKQKISLAKMGKKRSEETKRKISESAKQSWIKRKNI